MEILHVLYLCQHTFLCILLRPNIYGWCYCRECWEFLMPHTVFVNIVPDQLCGYRSEMWILVWPLPSVLLLLSLFLAKNLTILPAFSLVGSKATFAFRCLSPFNTGSAFCRHAHMYWCSNVFVPPPHYHHLKTWTLWWERSWWSIASAEFYYLWAGGWVLWPCFLPWVCSR